MATDIRDVPEVARLQRRALVVGLVGLAAAQFISKSATN